MNICNPIMHTDLQNAAISLDDFIGLQKAAFDRKPGFSPPCVVTPLGGKVFWVLIDNVNPSRSLMRTNKFTTYQDARRVGLVDGNI